MINENEYMLPQKSSKGSSVSVIGFCTFLGAVLSFFSYALIAFYFGAKKQTDAYFMSISIPLAFSKLLLSGQIQSIFMPFFMEHQIKGLGKKGWELASNVFNIIGLFCILLITLLTIFAPLVVSFMAPGYDYQSRALTITLSRIVLPTLLFTMLSGLLTSILNALGKFIQPAIFTLFTPLLMIISLLVLHRAWGIFCIAIGNLVGEFITLLTLLAFTRKAGFQYKFLIDAKSEEIRKIFKLLTPFWAKTIFSQTVIVSSRIVSSFLPPGSLTIIDYAEKIFTFLQNLVVQSISTVVYPTLIKDAILKNFVKFKENILKNIRMINFFVFPIATIAIVISQPAIKLLFERGSFDAAASIKTSIALMILMGFLFIEGYRSIFGKALYALKMTKEIVISVIIAASISVILNFILGYYFGYIGLAFAFAFTNFFHMFFYYLFLFKAIPQFKHIFYDAVSFKILFSALIMGVVCFFTLTFMNRALVLYTKLEQCIRISMVFFISILSYLIIARLYKIHEVKIFDSYVQKVMTNIQRILLGAKV